ncbi:MAG: M16 family metallopeptidase [Gemmatimonadales bacterium]
MTLRTGAARAGLIALLALPASRGAAQAVDRTHPPVLGPPPGLRLPPVETATLPNRLKLHVVGMHEVPLVQVVLMISAGGRLDDGVPGLASFTANMLDEGAGARDALEIAAEAAYLGATLTSAADWDHCYISLQVPRRNLDRALALMADVALRPRVSASEVVRQRDLRLASILQQRADPTATAILAFNAVVFPAGHPYHNSLTGDSASTAALDSGRVRRFYDEYFHPDRADLILTGDISLAEARKLVAGYFGAWTTGGAVANLPAASATPARTTVYLVDKPGAPQSVIRIGGPGVERGNPDYYAIEVMNMLLGGSFTGRLNQNLREIRGYTYGAFSGFQYRPLPGPFSARAAVRTEVTDSALVEFFRELRRIREEPADSTELQRAKALIALGQAGEFETTGQMAGQLSDLLTFELPASYFSDYGRRIMAVSAADVQRTAQLYLRPDSFAVLVTGDVARIRPGIEALGLGPVHVVDFSGDSASH